VLKAFAEAGVTFDKVIGTSAGAANLFLYAADPSPAGIDRLATAWLDGTVAQVFAPQVLKMAEALRQDGLLARSTFEDFFLDGIEPDAKFKIPLGIVATDASNATPYCFSADTGDSAPQFVHSTMAGMMFPPLGSPLKVNGAPGKYIDGGYVENSCIRTAVKDGAGSIVFLDISPGQKQSGGILTNTTNSIATVFRGDSDKGLEYAHEHGVEVLHVTLGGNGLFTDFSHPEYGVQFGYNVGKALVDGTDPPQPNWPPPLRLVGAAARRIADGVKRRLRQPITSEDTTFHLARRVKLPWSGVE
jgi:predicted acylesterase/phospholipase RssA